MRNWYPQGKPVKKDGSPHGYQFRTTKAFLEKTEEKLQEVEKKMEARFEDTELETARALNYRYGDQQQCIAYRNVRK
jgi:hypothetical protein